MVRSPVPLLSLAILAACPGPDVTPVPDTTGDATTGTSTDTPPTPTTGEAPTASTSSSTDATITGSTSMGLDPDTTTGSTSTLSTAESTDTGSTAAAESTDTGSISAAESTDTGSTASAESTDTGSTSSAESTDTGSTSAAESTDTGDDTGGAVDPSECDGPWTQPTACTSAACTEVTRTWSVCDKTNIQYQRFAWAFALDGSVFTNWTHDVTLLTEVVRIDPLGQVDVRLVVDLDSPRVQFNHTAIDFSVWSSGEDGSAVNVHADTGAPMYIFFQKFCERHWLIPGDTGHVRMHTLYLNEEEGCEYLDFEVRDGQNQPVAGWPIETDAPSPDVSATGVYYASSDDTFYRHALDGSLMGTYGPLDEPSISVAALADRQMVMTPTGLFHLVDGEPVGPGYESYTRKLAPHGEYSAVALYGSPWMMPSHDGVGLGAIDTGFWFIETLDVSDRGEIAVWAVALDSTEWIALYDAKSNEMWRARVHDIDNFNGLSFSHSGDQLVVRERDAISLFEIHR